MLGVLQSNLADGPVYFNCYPNFSVDINDPNVMDSLTLNVKIKNLNSKANTREIAIIYRVYYRLMKTTLAPKARIESPKGVTMLMEANIDHSTIFIPRLLIWYDILSNNDWHFDAITQPSLSHSERFQIERVIQFPDGSIDLKFLDNSRPSSFRRSSSSCPSTSCSLRPVLRPTSSSKNPEGEGDDATIPFDNDKGKLTRVDFSGDVPKVFYEELPTSPTASEMEPPQKPGWITMIKTGKTFNPDQGILHKLWTHPDNQTKRNWYMATYALKHREAFRDLWMADMRRIGCEIEFFKWFEMIGRIENQTKSLQMIVNKWYTTSNKVVESVTPSLEGLNIPVASTIIKASPFKERCDKPTAFVTPANIDRVVEQNNYSNQIIHVISRQIEDCKPSISKRPTPSSTSSSQNTETNPGITEWNIDCLDEHQVYNKLHEMGIVITAYKVRNSTDREVVILIASGFTGMLKHWWDNYCDDKIKHLIINETTTKMVVKTEGATETTSQVTREDGCATLLYHIAKHFIGEPKLFQDRSLQILNNLSCLSLDHFI
ncbi:hypothetical protein KY290_021426 [Solanum tuberosum]|uniref:Uncharacterized protein n=1 Tax=Solanum tuberosum TaxID=4113 RepID=A0ABQ7V2I9_SOLTU|nr:hypothetical protein KY289_020587 [Solanum tuberosum]KAH0693244.1 hypothetical protein KY285_020341 [Solanum tuberosum]KAH0757933.1 hypothetical protein KY290_021426 [Solanum tuberosum]